MNHATGRVLEKLREVSIQRSGDLVLLVLLNIISFHYRRFLDDSFNIKPSSLHE